MHASTRGFREWFSAARLWRDALLPWMSISRHWRLPCLSYRNPQKTPKPKAPISPRRTLNPRPSYFHSPSILCRQRAKSSQMQKTSHKRRTLASNVYGWHVHDVHMIHLSLCRSCCRETQAREGRKKENGGRRSGRGCLSRGRVSS